MSTRVVDRVDAWDDRPFTEGYEELHELADRNFSGVVRVGGTALYMTKGAVIGIRNGSIEDFQGASGTRYAAPASALPLLAIMQERSDEPRAQYYTEDTSISAVDQKLADGNFTGFVELSENVLSGDYYIVYHQGQSMSVAFIGEAERFVDGDEAFEQADGEVGIYEVRPVDIEPIEIPDPPEPEPDADSGPEETTDEESVTSGDEPPDRGETESAEQQSDSPVAEHTADPDTTGETADQSSPEETGESSATAGVTDPRDETEATGTEDHPAEQATTDQSASSRAEEATTNAAPASTSDGQSRRGQQSVGRSERDPLAGNETSESTETPKQGTDSSGEPPGRREGDTTRPLETHSIPSLDPARTVSGESTPDTSTRVESPQQRRDQRPQSGTPSQSEPRPQSPSRSQSSETPSATAEQTAAASAQKQATTEPASEKTAETDESGEPERLEALRSELEERESRLEEVENRLESVTSERDELADELEAVRSERDELSEEVERLESELERLETEFGAATDADRRITPQEALDGTDVFVRYHSKGDATLEKAHDGGIRRSDLAENLHIEKHTQFDAETVAVGGQSFGEFIEERLEYQFVEWVIHDLLFEIRDTGHSSELSDLFDVIPSVDRAELNAVIEVVYNEEGQETRTTESFDVVLRDRMGTPLIVANLNDSRQAATESDMEALVTAAERVGQTTDEFSAAFFVTRSFFEPGALETTSEATRGGLFSRDKRKSFVNLSRKRGYHLCLVEARNDNFHLAVPEL